MWFKGNTNVQSPLNTVYFPKKLVLILALMFIVMFGFIANLVGSELQLDFLMLNFVSLFII